MTKCIHGREYPCLQSLTRGCAPAGGLLLGNHRTEGVYRLGERHRTHHDPSKDYPAVTRWDGQIVLRNALSPALLNMIQAAAEAMIERRGPNQIISRSGSEYIHRWMLARKALVPIYDDPTLMLSQAALMAAELENLYLHCYRRPDVDDPHDHPWPNATLVVRGWFVEDVYVDGKCIGSFRRDRGDIVLRQASSVHAITSTSDQCLSLFATAPKERDWGFHTAEGWVPWRQFVRSDARQPGDA